MAVEPISAQSNIAHSVPVGDTKATTTVRTLQNKIYLPAASALDEHASPLNRPARAPRRPERALKSNNGRDHRVRTSDHPLQSHAQAELRAHRIVIMAFAGVLTLPKPKITQRSGNTTNRLVVTQTHVFRRLSRSLLRIYLQRSLLWYRPSLRC